MGKKNTVKLPLVKEVKCSKCNNGKNWVCKKCNDQLADEHDSAKIIIRALIESKRSLERQVTDLIEQLETLRREIRDFDKCEHPSNHYYKGGRSEP